MRKIFLIMAILGVTGPAMALTARSGTNADGRVAMGQFRKNAKIQAFCVNDNDS